MIRNRRYLWIFMSLMINQFIHTKQIIHIQVYIKCKEYIIMIFKIKTFDIVWGFADREGSTIIQFILKAIITATV